MAFMRADGELTGEGCHRLVVQYFGALRLSSSRCRREKRQCASYLLLRFCVCGLCADRGDDRGLGICSGLARMIAAIRSLKSSVVSTFFIAITDAEVHSDRLVYTDSAFPPC